MRWLNLILATWRLTYMLRHERGLFALAETFREEIAPNVAANQPPETEIEQAVECFYCFSVHVGVIILILEYICPALVDVLALSAGAIAVDRWNNG